MKVYFHDIEPRVFTVSLDGQLIHVDSLTEPIEVNNTDALTMEVSQQREDGFPKWARILWWLTLPVQAVLAVIMWYSEDIWYKQVNPWLLRFYLDIAPDVDSIHIRFTDRKVDGWMRTEVQCEGAIVAKTEYHKNADAIMTAYARYKRRVVAVTAVAMAFFLWLAIRSKSWICFGLIAALMAVAVACLLMQKNRAKKMFNAFGYFDP